MNQGESGYVNVAFIRLRAGIRFFGNNNSNILQLFLAEVYPPFQNHYFMVNEKL